MAASVWLLFLSLLAVPASAELVYISTDSGISIVDAKTPTVTGTIDLGSSGALAISPDGAKLYVAVLQAEPAIAVIDTATKQRTAILTAPGDTTAFGSVSSGPYIYVGHIATCDSHFQCTGRNALSRIDSRSDELVEVASFDTERSNGPIDIAADASGSVYILLAAGEVVLLDPASMITRHVTVLPPPAPDLEINSDRREIYVSTLADLANAGELNIISQTTGMALADIGVETLAPSAMATSFTDGAVYLSGEATCSEEPCYAIARFNPSDRTITAKELGSNGGGRLAVTEDSIFVLSVSGPSVTVLEPSSMEPRGLIELNAFPHSIAIQPQASTNGDSGGCSTVYPQHNTHGHLLYPFVAFLLLGLRRRSGKRKRIISRLGLTVTIFLARENAALGDEKDAVPLFAAESVRVSEGGAVGVLTDESIAALGGERASIEVPIDSAHTRVLLLERFSPLAEEPRVRFDRGSVEQLSLPDGLAYFKGVIPDEPTDSAAFVRIHDKKATGFLIRRSGSQTASMFRFRSSDAEVDGSVEAGESITAPGLSMMESLSDDNWCGAVDRPGAGSAGESSTTTGGRRLRARIAVEVTDQALEKFPGTGAAQQNAAIIFIIDQVAAASALFGFWADIDFSLTYIQIWSNDPTYYDMNATTDQGRYCAFRAFWEHCFPRHLPLTPPSEGSCPNDPPIQNCAPDQPDPSLVVPRDVAVEITAPVFGSVGFSILTTLRFRPERECSEEAYVTDGLPQEFDPDNPHDVFPHEIAHVFGSPHSQCYVPPLDKCTRAGDSAFVFGSCYSGPKVEEAPGTASLMSTCRTQRAIPFKFHTEEGLWIHAFSASTGCLQVAPCSGPGEPDADGDGVADHCDNCPALSNPTQAVCVGDCDCNGAVSIDEIGKMVSITMGDLLIQRCRAGDRNGDGIITVDESVQALRRAQVNCGITGGGSSGPSASLRIGTGQGLQGASVRIPITTEGSGGGVAGAQTDIVFDRSGVSIANPTVDCSLGANLNAANFTLSVSLPDLPRVTSGFERVRLVVSARQGVSATFGDGEIAACTFTISPTASITHFSLDAQGAVASDQSGNRRNVTMYDGSISVCNGCGCG